MPLQWISINTKPAIQEAAGAVRGSKFLTVFAFALAAVFPGAAQAQQSREFRSGALERIEELPAGRFRNDLEKLPPAAKGRALNWLRGLHFPTTDVESMHVDESGGVCYACQFGHAHGESEPLPELAEPQVSLAPMPVEPFPDSLKFNSRPGLAKRSYINFVGQTVSGTAWNTSLGREQIVALPYSTDTDYSTFSDTEQAAIKRIWQRMAEDYAPFDVNVTTERPATINTTTAIVLITRNTDANGNPNPASTAGGVAYVNVYGRSDFITTYSPAWVYHNNLGNSESNIAEAASHEIGHNLGLTHDGTTTQDYYGGHGSSSDPISWGPLMGTGYGKNVSQWSKGEYLNANNTQDDLSIIASKLGYRTDDHGSTLGSATPLAITGGTTISYTTPENDPNNANPANKGVIERNTDVDVFSFVTGAGAVQLNANPWIQPAGTRGGNLDILLELYNDSGSLIASSNPANQTTATLSATLSQGLYYLHVRNSGTGDPLASPPTGYTSYGSIGQYFISGTVVDGSGFVVPPVAEGQFASLTTTGQSTHTFTVTYSDNVAINVSTIGAGDTRVIGPGGYNQLAQLVSVSSTTNGTPRSATYSVAPAEGGAWGAIHNGSYTVSIEPNQVQDTEGEFVPVGELGQFQIAIPVPLYSANMSLNPGWTMETPWSFGVPNYPSGGPKAGFMGSNVIGHSMSFNYEKGQAMSYATTPVITNAATASSLTLRFQRWLGLRRNDTAILQVSGDNGGSWVTLWSSSSPISDSSWQLLQYPLPQSVIGSSQIRLRWGLSSRSGGGSTAIGWHIDDVELLGGGALDASPPDALLSVADITKVDSPTHSCTVTYTDSTAVLQTSVDVSNLLVIGPAGQLSPLVIGSVGVDLPGNGTPMGATYSINAPGGIWDTADNGDYTITLQEDAVEDTLGNTTPETVLGTFSVNISELIPGVMSVTPPDDLISSGDYGGSVSPSSREYILTNSGQTELEWSADKTADWVSLSPSGGTLAAGASTSVVVSINGEAASLPVGDYDDTVSFSNLTNNNGNTIRGVELTVKSIPVSVTLGDLTAVYDGNPKPVSVTTDPSPREVSVTYGGQPDAPINAGEYAVLATITQAGHTGSASGALVIAKADQTIEFAELAPLPYDHVPFVLGATASSSLPVSYESSDPTVATVSGNMVTVKGAGETTITASQPGDGNHQAATPVPRTLAVLSAYQVWAEGAFANELTENGPDDDPDGDGLVNLLEFAFGTDPTAPNPAALAYSDGSLVSPGSPVLTKVDGVFHAVFARRKDHAALGLIYTVYFSADLSPDWTVGEAEPLVIASGEEIDAVKVPFPTTVPEPRFFRVGVSLVP